MIGANTNSLVSLEVPLSGAYFSKGWQWPLAKLAAPQSARVRTLSFVIPVVLLLSGGCKTDSARAVYCSISQGG